MFNLEQAITSWRKQMIEGGISSPKILDELEAHLREDFERRVRSASSAQNAFEAATQQLGVAGMLTSEFAKVGETNAVSRWLKDFFLTLAGIPNASLATNMNTSSSNSNIQPAWATYLKSGAFVLPTALVAWFISIFVLPKFNQVLGQSGLRLPAGIHFGVDLARLIIHDIGWIAGVFVVALALLEWRSSNWPRYRRATFGVAAFLLNSFVLIAITTMVILALIAGPLVQHAK